MSITVTTVGISSLNADFDSASLMDVVNHELRTPLTILVGHVELLQELDVDLSGQAARSFAAIVDAASRLTDVADRISRIADRQGVDAAVLRVPAGSRSDRTVARMGARQSGF